jgi:hypothetical protein
VEVRVQYLHIRIGGDVGCRDLALTLSLNADYLRLVAVHLKVEALEVEYYSGGVFDNTGYGREFVEHALDLDGSYRRAWQRGQKDPP